MESEPVSRGEDQERPAGGDRERSREAYEKARRLLNEGALAEAINELKLSVAEYPHFKALELLGEAWLRKGEPLRALVPLAAASMLNTQVRAPSLLAEALLALGETIDAHRIALVALQRDPKNRKAKDVFDATQEAYKNWSGE